MLSLRAEGLSRKEIAARLNVSVHTVKAHLANVYFKLGAHGTVDALRISRTT